MDRFSRRTLLKSGLAGAVVLGGRIPAFLRRALAAESLTADPDGTVVVAIQLAGGNDGLNTLVPFDDDIYRRNRPTLALTKRDVIPVQDGFGLHARLRGLVDLLQQHRLAIIHAVGYPNPNGDHARSMEIWQTAEPENPCPETGWLGRAADTLTRLGVPRASCIPPATPSVFVGEIATPLTVVGRASVCVKTDRQSDLMLDPSLANNVAGEGGKEIAIHPADASLESATVAPRHAAQRVAEIAGGSTARNVAYPQTAFGNRLAFVAQLIRAELGVRIICTEMGGEGPGGFDTHSLQDNNHGELLGELGDALTAFVTDLARDQLLERVVVYTYSEFGRTIRENGRHGTDHGSAAPMFVAGGNLRRAIVGNPPNLSETENGGVKHTVDFRQVYAAILDRWLAVSSQEVLGASFSPIPLLE